MFGDFSHLVHVGHLEKGYVAVVAILLTLNLLDLRQELRTLGLQELTVRVVIFERDTILLHNIIVE